VVSEIVIKKENAKNLDDLVANLRRDPRFELYAAQFSESPSASNGGNLGWLNKGQLAEPLDNKVLAMKEGEVSDPIQIGNEFYILKLVQVYNPKRDKPKLPSKEEMKKFMENKKMNNAVYSPCDVCTAKPNPLWQLKARKIKHDAESQNVYYKDAVLEIKGFPVFYTPFLSHPDPNVSRRSGFLIPGFGSSSYLDAYLQPKYFWDISPHEDLTLAPYISTNHGLIMNGTYRRYFERGYLTTQGSIMRDQDDDETRGNLYVKSLQFGA
jgi:hypothetical protein